MAYNAVIDFARCGSDDMRGLLCSSLDGNPEYEKYLGKKEDDYRKDTYDLADNLKECDSDCTSDDTAGKDRCAGSRIADYLGTRSGSPEERQSLECRCLTFSSHAETFKILHIHGDKGKKRGYRYEEQYHAPDSYS